MLTPAEEAFLETERQKSSEHLEKVLQWRFGQSVPLEDWILSGVQRRAFFKHPKDENYVLLKTGPNAFVVVVLMNCHGGNGEKWKQVAMIEPAADFDIALLQLIAQFHIDTMENEPRGYAVYDALQRYAR